MIPHLMNDVRRTCWYLGIFLVASAQAEDLDLSLLSLEDLMEIEVELVSRRPGRVSDVPAAITVLTADDLRRTGARELPDALRLIPGMNVGRVDANKWAVTARGFNSLFANKLLVLIDGRSVYTPAFSGVFWEAQDVVLADIERIEVIRGPGGSLWGSNAVNGIINVVTKPAAETHGSLVEIGAGTRERLGVTARHATQLSDDVSLRIYGRWFDRRASVDSLDNELDDDWSVSRLGARVDWTPSPADRLSLHASAYDGVVGAGLQLVSQLTPPYVVPVDAQSTVQGSSLMGVWHHDTPDGGNVTLQAYYDHTERTDPGALMGIIDIADVDFQHRLQMAGNTFAWGLGYRLVSDEVEGSFAITTIPAQRNTHLFSGFAQLDGALSFDAGWSLGGKIERNSHTGFEAQPAARLWWAPVQGHLLWGAVSRAVRTPSRSDNDMEFAAQVLQTSVSADSTLPTLVTIAGNPDLKAENLLAFEVGYRARLRPDLSTDLSLFVNRYDDLRTSEAAFPSLRTDPLPHFYLPLRAGNLGRGTTWGAESTITWQVLDTWRLYGTYSLLRLDLELIEGSSDQLFLSQQDESPQHVASLRSMLEVTSAIQLDVVARFVDELPAQDIPSYLTLDAIVGWQLSPDLRLSLSGRHLLDAPHPEYAPLVSISAASQVETDLHATISWTF